MAEGVLTGEDDLVATLRQAGFSRAAIDAAWPSWWAPDARDSPSARAELRFALARRLGLEPGPLLGERVEFIWNDEARFKHLSTETATQKAALTSFGISMGRLLLRATPGEAISEVAAETLRDAILAGDQLVDLHSLLATCWGVGIPVVHLRVFPLDAKSMHAMVVSIDGRFAIMLGRDASYPAPIAFSLAHELGHLMLGHLGGVSALVDLEDPAVAHDRDAQEIEADEFALTLLTGSPKPNIQTSVDNFNAPTLAAAVMSASVRYRVEPGTLSLCLAYQREIWPIAMSSLRFIYNERKLASQEINAVAAGQLDWGVLGEDAAGYLRNVTGLNG